MVATTVLPIYYIESDVLEEDDLRSQDGLAQIIHERQWHDWRELRRKPFESMEVQGELERLAKQIKHARRAMPPGSPPSEDIGSDKVLNESRQDYRVPEQMSLIPEGRFIMGSPDDPEEGDESERPDHEVVISRPFEVGCYLVTFDEYDSFLKKNKGIPRPNDGGGSGRRPVINVSWDDAQRYCRWMSEKTGKKYRLLSEAEWEYCCRAGATTRYSCGDTISRKQANYSNNEGGTTEVGSYPANPWGLYDMHGNVWEWVEDCWHDNYHGAPKDGSPWVDKAVPERVVRGGAWGEHRWDLRAAVRKPHDATLRTADTGFRIARDLDHTEDRMLATSDEGGRDEQGGSN